MNGLKEDCKCGHDKASHYREWTEWTHDGVKYPAGTRAACLCRGCDCMLYRAPTCPYETE